MNAETMDLEALGRRLDRLEATLDVVVRHHEALADLLEESGPIMLAAQRAGVTRFAALEDRGIFDLGREAVRVAERVVDAFSPEDVRLLGDEVVHILDTVRNMTQSDVLAMANEATDAIHHADELEPVGVMGMARATGDADVQRGMALALEVLKRVGRASRGGAAPRPRPPVRREPTAPKAEHVHRAPEQAPACPAVFEVEGHAFNAEGFLIDAAAWDRTLAVQVAATLGLPPLTDAHWQLVDHARSVFLDTGTSPNVRALSRGAGVDVRTIYGLFPKAPGKTVAQIAGIPKPAGCI